MTHLLGSPVVENKDFVWSNPNMTETQMRLYYEEKLREERCLLSIAAPVHHSPILKKKIKYQPIFYTQVPYDTSRRDMEQYEHLRSI